MAENKFKKIFYSKAVIFILLLACIWLSISLVKAIYKKHQLNQEIASVKSEIEKLDKKSQELTQTLDYFKSQSFLEKEAKEKLNLKKEGETVVMVPESQLSGQAAIGQQIAQATTTEEGNGSKILTETKNNLIKWWEYFFVK